MEAVGYMLPIAVAVAISSVPIMATLIILLSPNRSRSAVPFMIGWVIGIVLVVAVCTLLAQAVPTSRSPRQPDIAVGAIEILVGAALIVLAIFSWRRARRNPEPAMPGWLKSSGKLRPWEAFGVAFVLNLRPKSLLLAIAAGLTIRTDADSLSDALIAILVYTVIAASTVAGPIIATLLAPSRMEPNLVHAHDWLLRNGGLLTALILFFIGVVVLGMGIARL